MRKVLLLLICLPLLALAQSPFEQGNRAYDSADYAAAAELYRQAEPSAAALYNLGNALYRQGELGQAILCYERALRIAPRDRDAKENLAFCYSKTEDHIESIPQLFLARWWKGLTELMNAHAWMWLTLLLLAAVCGGICLFFLSRDYVWRKGSLLATLALAVFLLLASALTFSASHPAPEAIVTAPMAVVKSSPDAQSTELFILHEGTKVTLDDEVAPWHKIHIADGQKGWIETSNIQRI